MPNQQFILLALLWAGHWCDTFVYFQLITEQTKEEFRGKWDACAKEREEALKVTEWGSIGYIPPHPSMIHNLHTYVPCEPQTSQFSTVQDTAPSATASSQGSASRVQSSVGDKDSKKH